MKSASAYCVLSLSLFFAIGCTSEESATAPPAESQVEPVTDVEAAGATVATVNKYCPIMGGKVNPEAPTVTWNEKVIGFCCEGCDAKFQALSEEEKEQKLQAALDKEKQDSTEGGSES